MSETIGFIGLGNMGPPIALNLLRAGYRLRVYNRTKSKAVPLAREGATVVERHAEVAEPGGIVLTMLADDRALEELCYAKPSFVDRLESGGVHVSLSTISPETARKFAKHHAERNVEYVASPVLGRPEAAASKKLFVYTSGPAEAKKRVHPIHAAMSQGVFDFGADAGAANVVKLCANFLVAASIEALAELLTLAEKNGVGKKAVAEMIGKFSPLHGGYAKIMAEGQFEPAGFRLALGMKDVNLIMGMAAASVTPLPLASLLHDRWLTSMAKGRENLDWSAIALDVEDAGIRVKAAP